MTVKELKCYLNPLEALIFKGFCGLEEMGSSFLVCCSGGADSVAVAFLMKAFLEKKRSQGESLKVGVAYIHHGLGGGTEYRQRAYEFVKGLSVELELPFYSNRNCVEGLPRLPEDEESLRHFRWHELSKIQESYDYNVLVQGHHWDDLLETRLIRLIRGTGAEGLEAMRVWGGIQGRGVYRPFLKTRREDIKSYVKSHWPKGWLEDPSNKNRNILRNWIRHEWLKDLEEKRPGAVNSLGSSLDLLTQEILQEPSSEGWKKIVDSVGKVCRLSYISLGESEQKRFLAFYLREQGVRAYTSGHINEIYKRLRTEQKEFSFSVVKRTWVVDARCFYLESV